jgi:hypothetical protein
MTEAPSELHPLAPGPLPPKLRPLSFLVGTWRGGGRGEFPTIDGFDYGEDMVFEHVGDPFLLYTQRSWLASDGTPLHFERGFLRPGAGEGEVELALAHPLGLTEISEGRVEGTTLVLTTREVGRTSTGMAVRALARRYRVDGDALHYELDMATDETPMTRHLTAELRRLPG